MDWIIRIGRISGLFVQTIFFFAFSFCKIGKVLLVGTVESQDTSIKAEELSWQTKNVKEVANYISVGKNDIVDISKEDGLVWATRGLGLSSY